MSRRPGSGRSLRSRRWPALAAVLALGAGLALGACSSGSGGSAVTPIPETTLVPAGTGDSCTDPTGDLDLPAGVPAATPGLDGIDIVSADASVEGDQLVVTMTMAGPLDATPVATYVVAQGEPLGAFSFEIRLAHGEQGWSTLVVTWPSGKEKRTSVPVLPTVDGATLTASVPLDELPQIGLAMQFGSSATVGDQIVIDDCNSLSPQG